ncbi:methyltransferase domain-containing protein [Kribbella sancticallisti]|uniref:Methyltransferase domain-containing protein n=1 Tax=Kribbella sancticallisti TaxID=460087 RepID=A0ABN2CV15_9ACTN
MNRAEQETFQLTAELAEAYEAWFVPGFFAQWAPHLLDGAGVAAGQRVLDVGCGTGIVARTAAERVGSTGTVAGVDLNEAMLAVARRVAPELQWRQGDAGALPFDPASFDVVLSQMAMMFFPEPAAALREMRRVVRPGGTVGVLVPGSLATNPPYELFVDVVTRNAGEEARRLVTSYFALGDLDGLTGLLTDAGLDVTATGSPVGEFRYDSIDQLVGVELDSTPLGGRLEPGVREAILADCQNALAGYLTSTGEVLFPFESRLVIATK